MTAPALTASLDAAHDAERESAGRFVRAIRSTLRRRLQLARVEEHEQWDSEAVDAITDAAAAWQAAGTREAELRVILESRTRQLDQVRAEFRDHEERVRAALSTEAHSMTARGGLPFCSCDRPLATGEMDGKATEDFISHALDVLAAERAADATVGGPEPETEPAAGDAKPPATGRRTGMQAKRTAARTA